MLSDFEGVKFEALTQSSIDIFSQIVSISNGYQEEFAIIADNIDHPGRLADYIASIISLQTEDKQRINQSQKELGDTEELAIEIDECRDQIKHLNLPEKPQKQRGEN